MKYTRINNKLFVKNRIKLSTLIEENSFAIIESNYTYPRNGDQFHKYRQNSDLFYLTGIEQEESVLLLYPKHKYAKNREILFIKKPDKKTEIWYGKKLTKEQASLISGISNVKWLSELDKEINLVSGLSEKVFIQSSFENDVIPKVGNNIKKSLNTHEGIEINWICQYMTELRLVKEPEEIELIQKAISITNDAYIKVLKSVKPNIKEFETEAVITHEFLKQGASGHAYEPIIASGKNACILHYIENDETCKSGDLILFDFGAEYANYAADLSRTIPVDGTFTKRQKDVYNAVLKVQKEAIKLYIPGNSINTINSKVEKLIEIELIKLGLFTKEDVKNQDKDNPLFKKYFMHGTAHFLGLDVHDVGSKTEAFKENMVLTCEPGIYIEEEGIGVRIENDIIVAKEPIDLMSDFPREIEEIELLMATQSK